MFRLKKKKKKQVYRNWTDNGPGPEKLKWYPLKNIAMENYIKGHAVISADTNNDGGRKFCVIPYDKIESLIESTPNEYRNFYELAINEYNAEFQVKLYYYYDLKGEMFTF